MLGHYETVLDNTTLQYSSDSNYVFYPSLLHNLNCDCSKYDDKGSVIALKYLFDPKPLFSNNIN